jgi:SprB repeat
VGIKQLFFGYILLLVLLLQFSCSKTGTSLPPAPPDPCSFVSIGVSGSVTNPSVAGATNGNIQCTATGSSGITFSINNGAFQSSGVFSNLAAGTYTVVAKSPEGCIGSVSFTLTNPAVQCTGVNISVSLSATSNVPCEANSASITVNASGGTMPYMYSLDGGIFQSANSFTNTASGSHIITVKDANGCAGSGSTTVNNYPIGSLFAQVKSIVQYSCIGCHSATNSQGGLNLAVDCNIVAYKERIKARAVDGNPSPMPVNGLLPANQRQRITDWINAGGQLNN